MSQVLQAVRGKNNVESSFDHGMQVAIKMHFQINAREIPDIHAKGFRVHLVVAASNIQDATVEVPLYNRPNFICF
jgi:hypothetical protein